MGPEIMDFSHKINNLQIGKSISRLKRLSRKFKDIINPTSLKGEEFIAKNQNEGHSRFLYELNIVTAKIGRYVFWEEKESNPKEKLSTFTITQKTR